MNPTLRENPLEEVPAVIPYLGEYLPVGQQEDYVKLIEEFNNGTITKERALTLANRLDVIESRDGIPDEDIFNLMDSGELVNFSRFYTRVKNYLSTKIK